MYMAFLEAFQLNLHQSYWYSTLLQIITSKKRILYLEWAGHQNMCNQFLPTSLTKKENAISQNKSFGKGNNLS